MSDIINQAKSQPKANKNPSQKKATAKPNDNQTKATTKPNQSQQANADMVELSALIRQFKPATAEQAHTQGYDELYQHACPDGLLWLDSDIEVNDYTLQANQHLGAVMTDHTGQAVNMLILGKGEKTKTLNRHAGVICLGNLACPTAYVVQGIDEALSLANVLHTQGKAFLILAVMPYHLLSVVQAWQWQKQLIISINTLQQDELLPKLDNIRGEIWVSHADLWLLLANSDSPDDVIRQSGKVDLQLTELQAKKAQLTLAIAELAKLDEMELQLSVKSVANQFGLPQARIMQYVAEHKRGAVIPDVAPYAHVVDGKELYQELYALADNHMIMDEPLKVTFALWVIFSYLIDISYHAPLAWITAPEKACGKSTLLSLFERVVNRPMTGSSITPAVLFRVTEKHKPTLLIDEIDMLLKDNNELLGIINAGYSRHAPFTWRYDTDEKCEKPFNVYGAKVFSGIGGMSGTFMSRSIRFELRRKHNDDKPIKRINEQDLPRSYTDSIKAKIKRWSDDNRQAVSQVRVTTPNKLGDREFDNWYILLQIAKVLGVYDVALQACLSINQTDKEPSVNEQLLSDIRDVFKTPKMFGVDLCERLNDDPELCWGTYNKGQALAYDVMRKKLKGFGIETKQVRIGAFSKKGYDIEQFQQAFKRYLPPVSPPLSNDVDIWDS